MDQTTQHGHMVLLCFQVLLTPIIFGIPVQFGVIMQMSACLYATPSPCMYIQGSAVNESAGTESLGPLSASPGDEVKLVLLQICELKA